MQEAVIKTIPKKKKCKKAKWLSEEPLQIAGASLVAQRLKRLLVMRRPGFDPWVGKIPWRRKWQPTPVFMPGESHGQRSQVGYRPWGCKESDTTELSLSLSCIGEGNGNPLQYSCLENPRDGGAWWAAVYGVAQSRTRLKRLSSSSSSPCYWLLVP